jgi:hypothetical protein
MQNQHLMKGLEEFFQASHPVSAPVMPVSSVTPSIGTTSGVVTTPASSGNLLLKVIIVGGGIILFYCLTKNHFKVHKQNERSKRF